MVRKMLAATAAAGMLATVAQAARAEAYSICVRAGVRVTPTSQMIDPGPFCTSSPYPTRPLVVRQDLFGYAQVEVVVTYP